MTAPFTTAVVAAGTNYLNGTNGSPSPISAAEILGIFVGIPLAALVFFALFTLRQRAVGAVQYRPGRPWAFGQEWFGTRPEGDQPRVAVPGSGGASARW